MPLLMRAAPCLARYVCLLLISLRRFDFDEMPLHTPDFRRGALLRLFLHG